jgi:hypothetical protein
MQRVLALRSQVSSNPVVPILMNFKHSGPLPLGVLPHARATIEFMNPRDFVVVAHASGYVRSMAEAFRLLNPSFQHRVLLADTLDDARTLIADKAAQA